MTSSGNIIHASRTHSIINVHDRGGLNRDGGLIAVSACNWGLNKGFTLPRFCRALIFLNCSDLEPITIFNFLLCLPENLIFGVLLHVKTMQEFTLFIDDAKVHLQAVL